MQICLLKICTHVCVSVLRKCWTGVILCRLNKVGHLYYGKKERIFYTVCAYILVVSVISFGREEAMFADMTHYGSCMPALLCHSVQCCLHSPDRMQGLYVESLLLGWSMVTTAVMGQHMASALGLLQPM